MNDNLPKFLKYLKQHLKALVCFRLLFSSLGKTDKTHDKLDFIFFLFRLSKKSNHGFLVHVKHLLIKLNILVQDKFFCKLYPFWVWLIENTNGILRLLWLKTATLGTNAVENSRLIVAVRWLLSPRVPLNN